MLIRDRELRAHINDQTRIEQTGLSGWVTGPLLRAGIHTVRELREALESGALKDLPRFGARSYAAVRSLLLVEMGPSWQELVRQRCSATLPAAEPAPAESCDSDESYKEVEVEVKALKNL